MRKIFLVVLFLLMFVMVGCGNNDLNFGKKLVKADGMVDILVELESKNSDVGVMDSIMAGYYINQQYKDKLMIVPDLTLADEEYGIATRKEGEYTAKKISAVLIELSKSGKVLEIANKYGLKDSLAIDESVEIDLTDETGKADFDEIMASGEMVIGYTIFAPIAYEEDNKLIGFDIELAEAVCAELGIKAKFQLIDWDSKIFELNAGSIDVIWNGMTITDKIKEGASVTIPYLKNKQVAVIRVADKDLYKTTADMKDAVICVEGGSAGQLCVEKEK